MVISNNSNNFELGENEYIFGRKYCKFQRVFVGMKMVIREKTVLQERNMNFEFICIFFTHKKKKLIMAIVHWTIGTIENQGFRDDEFIFQPLAWKKVNIF